MVEELLPARRLGSHRQEREHSAGAAFFCAVGIVAGRLACSACAGIVNLLDAQRTALAEDLSGEVDLVVRRTNARTELNHEIAGNGTEPLTH